MRGGKAPCNIKSTLDVGWVVSFRLRPHYRWGKSPMHLFIWGCEGPRFNLAWWQSTEFLFQLGIESRPSKP